MTRNAAVTEVLLERLDRQAAAEARRAAEAARLARVRAEPQPFGPTPERRRRLSAALRLYRVGTIGPLELRAAEDVVATYQVIEAAVFTRALDPQRPAVQGGRARYGLALPPEVLAVTQIYRRWRAEMAATPAVAGAAEPSLLGLVVRVLVDGAGLRDAEREWRLRSGSLAAPLARALRRYVDYAGWPRHGA